MEVFGRKVAERAEPDLGARHPACARRAGEVVDTADDIADQCRLMHGGRFLPLEGFGVLRTAQG